eukprot:Gb_40165 [translate_table: standard]
MPQSVHSRQSVTRISFGIYMPQDGCHIDDAIAHISRVSSALEQSSGIKVAILKNLDLSWAAVFSVWRGGNVDESTIHLPEAAAFTKGMRCVVRIVDSGWFELTSQEKRQGVPFAELCLGDIVSVRRTLIFLFSRVGSSPNLHLITLAWPNTLIRLEIFLLILI